MPSGSAPVAHEQVHVQLGEAPPSVTGLHVPLVAPGPVQASATDDIRQMLASNPSFHLLIAHGYSDLVTPYGVSRYVVDHLPPSLAENRVSLKLYRGGHMFYTTAGHRAAFTADAKASYAGHPAGTPAD